MRWMPWKSALGGESGAWPYGGAARGSAAAEGPECCLSCAETRWAPGGRSAASSDEEEWRSKEN